MTNQIQAIALLPKLSEQQLLQVLQQNDGSVPSYAVMAELQSRKKRSAGLAGPQMPTTSVKDDMTQEAAGGLQSLGPAPMAPRGMAGGGLLSPDEYEFPPETIDRPLGWDDLKKLSPLYWAFEGMKKVADRTEEGRRLGPAARGSAPAYMGPGTPGAGAGTDFVMPDTATPATPSAPSAPPARGGITSLRASASGKVSPGGPAPAGFDFKELQLRSIQDAMKDVPADGSLAEMIADYKARAGDADKRRQDAKYEALMRAGLTMARTPGGLRNSIAVGGLEGLGAYSAGMKEASGLERERMRELAALQQAQSAQALQRYGIANATRFGEAGIADKNQDNRFNAYKTGVESSDRRYAADAGVRAASIRADATGAGSASKVMSVLQKADTDARADAAKNLSDLDKIRMSNPDPAISGRARAEYEAKIRQTVLDKVGMMSMADPDLIPLYQQMRQQIGGSPATGGPAIIRGNGPPPGAVVRQ